MQFSQPYGQFAQQYQPTWPQHPWNGIQQPYQPQVQPQAQPQPQPRGVSGRTVASAEEITAQEVPMDGSMGLFPLADGSAVIGKAWGGDGTIRTVRYVPEAQPSDVAQPSFEDAVISRLDAMESALSALSAQRRTSRRKGADDES